MAPQTPTQKSQTQSGGAKTTSQRQADQLAETAEKTAEREQKAREARREANEQAYQASIEGAELPPSVVEAQAEDERREREDKESAEAGAQDIAETTERIASRPNNPPDQR